MNAAEAAPKRDSRFKHPKPACRSRPGAYARPKGRPLFTREKAFDLFSAAVEVLADSAKKAGHVPDGLPRRGFPGGVPMGSNRRFPSKIIAILGGLIRRGVPPRVRIALRGLP